MGNTMMQMGALVMLEAANEGGKSQFPFLAALILLAIVAVVAISDARADKKKSEQESSQLESNEENKTTKL